GKTSLAKTIAEDKHPSHVYYVSNWYQFTNLEGDRNFYYQQRYNKFQTNDTLTVYADLLHFGQKHGLDFADAEPILESLGFQKCRNTQRIELSSGEHRKLQLAPGLWLRPKPLIIDEPFAGLDRQSRVNLLDIFDNIAKKGTSLVLGTNEEKLPSCISRFAEIE